MEWYKEGYDVDMKIIRYNVDWHKKKYGCTIDELERYQAGLSTMRKVNEPRKVVIDFDKQIGFGKYKHQTGLEIAQHDVKYLVWANEQENITLTTELLIIVAVQVKAINERNSNDR